MEGVQVEVAGAVVQGEEGEVEGAVGVGQGGVDLQGARYQHFMSTLNKWTFFRSV